MLNKKNIAKLLLAGAMLGVTGCAPTGGPNFEKQADSFLQKKDYLKAIEFYEKSLMKNKGDKDLQKKLQRAKDLYINYRLGNYKSEYNKTAHTISFLNGLKTKAKELYTYNSNSAAINNFLQMLNKKEDELIAQIEKYKQNIYKLKRNDDYKIIIETLNKIVAIYAKFESTKFYSTYYKEAEEFFYDDIITTLNNNNLDSSYKKFDQFNKLFKTSSKKKDLQELITQYEEINKTLKKAKRAISNNNLDTALEKVLELKKVKVESKILKKEIKKVSASLAKIYLSNAREALADNKLSIAYFQLLNASKIKKSVSYLSLSKEILEEVYKKANMYKDMGLDGTAYALYNYINKIDANYKSTFVLKRDVKDILLKRNILKLAISEFVTPDLNKNSGTRFTASLTSQLFKHSTKDVQVIERNRLKLILDELKLQETGNIETLAQQRGKIKGINVFVFGDIVESSIDPQRVENKISKKIKIGTRKVSNPLFLVYLSKSKEERSSMQMPSQFIEEPEYQIISYVKGKITKTANLVVSVRIVDIQKGEIIAARTFEKQKIVSDAYNEGVEFAGISSDPEKIESDKTIMTDLQKEMINEISNFTMKSFVNREAKSVEKADYHVDRREYEKAMEETINNTIISEIKALKVSKDVDDRKDAIFTELLR